MQPSIPGKVADERGEGVEGGPQRPSTTKLSGVRALHSALSKFRKVALTVKAASFFNQLKGHAHDIDGQPVPDNATLQYIFNSGRHMAISVDGLSHVDIGTPGAGPMPLAADGPPRLSSLPERPTSDTGVQAPKPVLPFGNDCSTCMHASGSTSGTASQSAYASCAVVLDVKPPQAEGGPPVPPVPPPAVPPQHPAAGWASTYFRKWCGVRDTPIGVPPYPEVALTFVASFATLLLLCALTTYASPHMADVGWVVTSFGASAVLLFAAPESKLAQPRNFMGGQIIGAVIGTCVRLALGDWLWLSGPLATALALALMQLTSTTHPPAGGTALAIGLSPTLLPWEGFQVVVTVIIGSSLFLLCGLLFNNVSPKRRFPTFWYDQRL